MIEQVRNLIQAIHDSPTRAMIVTTGAGSQALADLLAVGGASRTLIEGLIPYSNASFDDFLGLPPAQYVAPDTARLLAGRAYTRARQLEGTISPLVGLACTAAIASDRPKRGVFHRRLDVIRKPVHDQRGYRQRKPQGSGQRSLH